MPPSGMTMAELREEIQMYLGGSSRCVELSEEELTLVVKSALRLLNKYKPQRNIAVIGLSSSQKKYGPLEHPGLRGIVKVEFVDPRYFRQEGVDPFDPFSYFSHTELTLAGMTFGEILQSIGYREAAKRIVNADADWYAEWRGHDYYLFVDAPTPVLCGYTYTWGLTPDDNEHTGVQYLPEGDVEWVVDYATAKAKQMLGRIRGKFMGIPGPNGPLQIDSDVLLSEAREELRELKESIQRERRPIEPLFE